MKNFGGILTYGIPEFRLPAEILQKTINKIVKIPGINVKYNVSLGKDFTLEELTKKYDGVFLAIGSNCSTKMNIDGENLTGVYGANELLENKNFPEFKGKTVAVIGGGNVAMDVARTVKKLGANEVLVIYRRAQEQMPAENREIEEAKKENIKFLFQNNITKILPNEDGKKVKKIQCIKTELVKKEESERLVPVNIPESNYFIDVDYVVMAVGSHTQKNILNECKLELDEKGYIKVDENYKTNIDKVFAGGDIIGSKQTVAWASRIGRDVANKIIELI